MIARALMLAALIVMAVGPALSGTRSLERAGTAALQQDALTDRAFHQALAETRQNHSEKTASSRCKGRSCLQPALQAAPLPDTTARTEQALSWAHDAGPARGVIVRVSPPPPKSAVS